VNVSSVLAQFKSTIILFEKGYECVALSELYGSQDHMLIIFMDLNRKCSTCYKL
jgi:hypothetical protein